MIELGPAGLAAAFAAGFVSFLSPCVLPLVPGYLSLVSGVGFEDLGEQPRRVVGASLAFVAGFGGVFVLFGLAFARAMAVTAFLRRHTRGLALASGAVLVVFGVLLASGQLVRLTTDLARFTGLSL